MTKTSLSLVLATLLFSPLCAQTVTLEDIMVTSTNKTPTSIEKTTANITVITAKEIETHGYLTVAEAIKSTAGITVSQSGGIGQQSSFFVRGADSGKVLVLLDGMRLNDPSTTNGTALLDSLITSNIAQIEIVKGASGSIWGPNASAGVINIITKENAEAGVHGYAGLTVGSYGTLGEEAQLSYKGQKLTAQVLASYLDSKSFSALAPREAEADGYTNKNLNLKL
ncbi:MAG: TonB-dependent receptor, partial [Sulfurovum sp.]